jgi:hypothetical protein
MPIRTASLKCWPMRGLRVAARYPKGSSEKLKDSPMALTDARRSARPLQNEAVTLVAWLFAVVVLAAPLAPVSAAVALSLTA